MSESRETTRDRVWLHVLEETMRNGNVVDASSVAEAADCSRKTAREVLKVMDRQRWIRERSTSRGIEYHPEYRMN
jgi:MarR-like DNA-binding transcriptional regulator SgrR of sgrS sRNA